MIQWKQGANPTAPYNDKTNQNKPILFQLWRDKYEALDAPVDVWTNEDEEKLERLRSGEIECFSRDVGLQHYMETEDEYLATRLLTIAPDRRQKVVEQVLQSIGQEEADKIIETLESM
ncbi:hypothetical protein SEMRO_85_G045330.1 [Seminavis robusta]|uniref:Uncharacterized protein n=1 Tax=Seminavis robusta TaxID=568900 RepID=A0A9N8DCY7_9STRA|nr:hypothetical protein SEMRO_85_G045330.1 [Seminavis robusta]|eukprot:Sro85_g045330.1 n/a (118) ;mRNA; f:58999-59352